jgi:hypothetical protein
MSYQEYDGLFKEAQGRGQYHLFVFDVENSRTLDPEFHIQARELLLNVYKRLEDLERSTNRKILHKNKVFNREEKGIVRRDLLEPFNIAGDCYGFTIIRGSMETNDVFKIWQEEKCKLGIRFNFHFAEGDYETDSWLKGSELYFRGYCIGKLEEMSKKNGVRC